MVTITRINGTKLTINSDLIEMMEAMPDTTITMTTGKKIIASESIDDIIKKIIAFRGEINKKFQ